MKTNNNIDSKDFHAVEFMRQVRAEMTELFFKDKKKYLEYLDQAMKEFREKQKKVYS